MRVAIVTDARATFPWSEDWKELCDANSIEFREFDSYDPDFIDKLLAYNPGRTLWRSVNSALMKFKDEAQRELLDKTDLRIIPNWRTHYLYDHKIRQSYLFKFRSIPHPRTKIFFSETHALNYIEKAEYPFVVKADSGAGSKSFRFIEDKEQARKIVTDIFHRKGKWSGREYENHVFYTQEYIPAPGIWRIWMFQDRVAVGLYIENRLGRRTASGGGRIVYRTVPSELFDMTMKINQRMGWDWSMYDIIWSEKYEKRLILEITDTVSDRGREKRKLTYYRKEDKWFAKEGNPSPQEIIFNLFILRGMT